MPRPRLHSAILAALLAGVLVHGQGTPPPSALTLLTREGRRSIPTLVQGGNEFVALDDVARLFQVTVREDTMAGGVTVSYKGQNAVASAEQPMASVNGRLVAMPAPAMRAGGRWYVPLEFLSRALGPIYDARIELRRPSRLLIVGELRVPRVSLRFETPGPPTRLVIDISPASEVATSDEPGRVIVRIAADGLDAQLPVTGVGLVDQVRLGEPPTTLLVTLRNAGPTRITTSVVESVTRVTIEVQQPGGTPAAEPQPPAEPIPPLGSRPALQTIAIDPGHGGEDTGVRAADGTLEKTVTLDVARRVKTLIEARLGIRVLLTREDDRAVPVDQRASVANNNKADLFISLHLNATFGSSLSGAEVLYLAADPEMEEARRAAEAASGTLPVLGGGTRTIDVVRWDMAQAPHLDSSAALAAMLEAELRSRVPMSPRPLQRAPLRVLVGANMPAVLVEMAYLTNAGQAKQAASAEFQTAVSQAIYETITRFRAQLEAKR